MNKNIIGEIALKMRLMMRVAAVCAAVWMAAPRACYASHDGIPLSDYSGGQPVVRIGVALKSATASIVLSGDYEVVERKSNTTLASGKGGAFDVILEPAPSPAIPGGKYRVSVGSFKSYEDASFAVERLEGMKLASKIVYLDQWYIWFGPYDTAGDAREVLPGLKKAGYPNAGVEPIPVGGAGLTVKDSTGKIIYSGTNAVGFQSVSRRVKVNDIEYRGDAEVMPDAGGKLSVANLVLADDYLKGVVPREMPSGAPPDALRAQAIIARTYLLNNRGRHVADGFELCRTSDCQVYGGIGGEVESTNKAVAETSGIVVAHGDRLANALFHSTCGGRTSSYGDIWSTDRPPAYLAAVDDGLTNSDAPLDTEEAFAGFLADKGGNCQNSKYYRWEVRQTAEQMREVLKESVPKFTNSAGLDIGDLADIVITGRAKSGRVLSVKITTTAGEYVFERDTIRWVLGKLRSTMFTIKKETDSAGAVTYVISGAGWGHGAGLCQMGTITMSRAGKDYKEILEHYYIGTELKRLW